jgi:hypothetical protein
MITIIGKHGVGPSPGSGIVEEVEKLGSEAELAPQQDVVGEEEVDGGAQVRLGQLFLLAVLLTGSNGVDHLRLVVPVLQDPRGPIRELEPPLPILAAHTRRASGPVARR